LVAATLIGILSCGSDPRVVVSITGPAPDELVRVRLLVRECGESRFALLHDIDTRGDITLEPLEAAVVPGKTFYVWVQAWSECSITPDMCPDENTAMPGTCLCFDGDPLGQKLESEACSRWIRAEEGVTEVPLRLGPLSGDCPPEPLEDCAVLE
jgi:hypothetical protein